jgi:hypothetical protein
VRTGCRDPSKPDSTRLLDLLAVIRDPVVDCVVLTDHQVCVAALDGGPLVGELASSHDHLEPTALPERDMLQQPQQRQRARGRRLSRRLVVQSFDLPDQPLALGVEECIQGLALRGERILLFPVVRNPPMLPVMRKAQPSWMIGLKQAAPVRGERRRRSLPGVRRCRHSCCPSANAHDVALEGIARFTSAGR